MRPELFDVFVCHSHHGEVDTKEASRLRRYLHVRGKKTFVSSDATVPDGVNWRAYTETVLMQCGLFVILITDKLLESGECEHEFKMALRHQRRILPVFIDREPPLSRSEAIQPEFIRLNDFQAVSCQGSVDDALRERIFLALGPPKVSKRGAGVLVWALLVALIVAGFVAVPKIAGKTDCSWVEDPAGALTKVHVVGQYDVGDDQGFSDQFPIFAQQGAGATECLLPVEETGDAVVRVPDSGPTILVWAKNGNDDCTDREPIESGSSIHDLKIKVPSVQPEDD